MLWLLLILSLVSLAHAATPKNVAELETAEAKIKVWPETVINPFANWQYINATSELWLFDTPKTIEWIKVQEYGDFIEEYTYCYDEKEEKCETRYAHQTGWHYIEEPKTKFLKQEGVDYSDRYLEKYDKKKAHQYRIKYKPREPEGKFNIEIGHNVLDPWWDSTNTTQGFVYLTNQSFSDTFEFYNATYNFTERWTVDDGNWSLNTNVNTGFGFNTTALTGSSGNGDGYKSAYINGNSYDNYELILKMGILQDFDNERCSVFTTSTGAGIQLRQNQLYIPKCSGGTNNVGITTPIGTVREIKIILNNSFISYYTRDFGNHTWFLIYNETCPGFYDVPRISSYEAKCAFDNVLIRELITNPSASCTANLHPSYIYDDAEEDEWDTVGIQYYRDGVLEHNYTITNPSDNNSYLPFTLYPGGDWYVNVSVCDDTGDCAWNLSQNVTTIIGTYINIYDELTTQAITDPISVKFRSDTFEFNGVTTTGQFIKTDTEIPPDLYQVILNGTEYYQRGYYITVTNASLQEHNFYLLETNQSGLITFYVKNLEDQVLENISIVPMRMINLTWKPVSHRYTDFSGATLVNLDPFARYYITFTDPSGTYSTKDAYVEPVFFSYTVYLNSTSPSTFSTIWDSVTYSMGITDKDLNPILTNFTFTAVSTAGNIDYFGLTSTYNGTTYTHNITTQPTGGVAAITLPLNNSINRTDNVNVSYFLTTTNPHYLIFPFTYSIINLTEYMGNYSLADNLVDIKVELSDRQRLMFAEMFAIMMVAVFGVVLRRTYAPVTGIPVLAVFALPGIAWIPLWLVAFQGIVLAGFFAVFGDW